MIVESHCQDILLGIKISNAASAGTHVFIHAKPRVQIRFVSHKPVATLSLHCPHPIVKLLCKAWRNCISLSVCLGVSRGGVAAIRNLGSFCGTAWVNANSGHHRCTEALPQDQVTSASHWWSLFTSLSCPRFSAALWVGISGTGVFTGLRVGHRAKWSRKPASQ